MAVALPAASPVAVTEGAEAEASATPSALFEDVAFTEAARTGKAIEILDRREESTEFFANPDGSTTRRSYGFPKWTRYDGMWRLADATIARQSDGSVGPVAPTFPITFSSGGDQPLATMVKKGRKLALTWPTALPEPVLDGDTATYRSVLPDVDLKLTAEVDGFAQHLVIHTPEAAVNPALKSIELGLVTDGVTLTEAADGKLLAKDASGETVFSAPSPKMWEQPSVPADESAGTASRTLTRSATAEPEQPDSAPVGVDISGGTLTLTPDAALLASADQFPLVIDPPFSGGIREKWAVVYSATPNADYPNGSGWNSSNPADEPRVGYNETGNTASFFAMNTSGLAGATINNVEFAVMQTHSYVCDSSVGPTELWSAGDITTTPTWNTQSWGSKLDSGSFFGGNDQFCRGDVGHEFASAALTAFVQKAADNGWGAATFGLKPPDSYLGNTKAYKRFKNNPVLSIDYNFKPVVISKAAYEGYYTESGDGNVLVPCGGRIGNNGISLTAKIKDQDLGGLSAYFQVKNSSGTPVALPDDREGVSGSGEASVTVPSKVLATGTYTWTVYAKDGENTTSAVTAPCSFSVDKVGPDKPVVVLDMDGTEAGEPGVPAKDGKPEIPGDTYPVRVPQKFKFTNTVSDVDGYCWAVDRVLSTAPTPRCPNGNWVDAGTDSLHTATVTLTLFAHPVSKINVIAYDKYKNISSIASGADQVSLTTTPPTFVYEKENSNPLVPGANHDRPGDLNGDGFADFVATDPDGQLWLYGGNGNLGAPAARQLVGTSGWTGALIAHRGDLKSMSSKDTALDGYEDFLVRLPNNKLYLYPGNGVGSPWIYTRKELAHPSEDDWRGLRQMLLPGNIDGKPGNDLITVQCMWNDDTIKLEDRTCVNARLILYSGNGISGDDGQNQAIPFDFDKEITLGTGGWRDLTNLAVSDVNGDSYADLVARDPSDGTLYLYPGCVNDAVACPGSDYKFLPRAVYGNGGWNQRPYLTSPGNTQGTLRPDEVTKQPSNELPPEDPDNQPKTYYFNRFIPTTGQEAGDIWATTPADPDTPVDYIDSTGTAKSILCPTGCLLIYPGGKTIHGAPRLAGTAGWATTIRGIF
ncbi:FG-GAP repeat domain-containing protein [Streptomyces hydrogenans]|uniref:FG-GAP repeat domain-containing protein n=1 Tax=Streptomyces hydrogenans TaxID=1873719 RepID=UPI00367B6667